MGFEEWYKANYGNSPGADEYVAAMRAWAAAVAEERERCATLAEELAKALQARGAGRPAVFVVEQMAVGIRQGF